MGPPARSGVPLRHRAVSTDEQATGEWETEADDWVRMEGRGVQLDDVWIVDVLSQSYEYTLRLEWTSHIWTGRGWTGFCGMLFPFGLNFRLTLFLTDVCFKTQLQRDQSGELMIHWCFIVIGDVTASSQISHFSRDSHIPHPSYGRTHINVTLCGCRDEWAHP